MIDPLLQSVVPLTSHMICARDYEADLNALRVSGRRHDIAIVNFSGSDNEDAEEKHKVKEKLPNSPENDSEIVHDGPSEGSFGGSIPANIPDLDAKSKIGGVGGPALTRNTRLLGP